MAERAFLSHSLKVVIPVHAVKTGLPAGSTFEPPAGTARAEIIATELLDEFLIAVDDATTAPQRAFPTGTLAVVCSSSGKKWLVVEVVGLHGEPPLGNGPSARTRGGGGRFGGLFPAPIGAKTLSSSHLARPASIASSPSRSGETTSTWKEGPWRRPSCSRANGRRRRPGGNPRRKSSLPCDEGRQHPP